METQLVDEILAWKPANKGCDLSYSHRTSYLTVQQQGTGSAERQKRAIASVGAKVRAQGNRVLAIELKPSSALRGDNGRRVDRYEAWLLAELEIANVALSNQP